eukprot:1707278-Rhodomonas_salina.1
MLSDRRRGVIGGEVRMILGDRGRSVRLRDRGRGAGRWRACRQQEARAGGSWEGGRCRLHSLPARVVSAAEIGGVCLLLCKAMWGTETGEICAARPRAVRRLYCAAVPRCQAGLGAQIGGLLVALVMGVGH